MPTPDQLADEFARCCNLWFSPTELAEIRRRNATPDYAGAVCATHDFCDANMIMLEAFEAVVGRPMHMDGGESPEEQADHHLWNEAWAIAKTKYLTENKQ